MAMGICIVVVLLLCPSVNICATNVKDLQRARTKTPHMLLKAVDDVHVSRLLNTHLQHSEKFTQPCEQWSVGGIQGFMASVLQYRNMDLQKIYVSTGDRRKLVFDKIEEYQHRWRWLNETVQTHPSFSHLQLEAHCREAVMMWVHNVDENARKNLRANELVVPLLPEGPKQYCSSELSVQAFTACNFVMDANSLCHCHYSHPHRAVAGEILPNWPATFRSAYHSSKERGKNTDGLFALGNDEVGELAQMVSFDDGTGDHLCSSYFNKTPCKQLTVKNWKWLIWPNLSKCCKCCSYETGCGPLSPTWLQNATGNLVYQGIETVALGHSKMRCKKWAVLGLSGWSHPNYYYEHLEENGGKPCEIDGYNYLQNPSEQSDDQYIFVPTTFSEGDIPPDTFILPSFCRDDSYCGQPVCDQPPVVAIVM